MSRAQEVVHNQETFTLQRDALRLRSTVPPGTSFDTSCDIGKAGVDALCCASVIKEEVYFTLALSTATRSGIVRGTVLVTNVVTSALGDKRSTTDKFVFDIRCHPMNTATTLSKTCRNLLPYDLTEVTIDLTVEVFIDEYDEGFFKYLCNGSLSDANVKVDKKVFTLSKVILCKSSPYFDGLFNGGHWMDSESTTSLDGFTKEAFAMAVVFMYTGVTDLTWLNFKALQFYPDLCRSDLDAIDYLNDLYQLSQYLDLNDLANLVNGHMINLLSVQQMTLEEKTLKGVQPPPVDAFSREYAQGVFINRNVM